MRIGTGKVLSTTTLLLASALCTATTVGSVPAAAVEGSCPNEARRLEQGSTYLPGCRAYELVTPPGARPTTPQAAVDGGAIAWNSYYPPYGTAGQSGGKVYLSRRLSSGAGWTTIGVIPPQSAEAFTALNCEPSMYLSPDLARGIMSDGLGSIGLAAGATVTCEGHNEPAIVSEPDGWQSEPEGFQNLFAANLGEGGPLAWRLVNRTPATVVPADAWVEAASTEEGDTFSRVVFEEAAQLTPEAPVGEDLYEWYRGTVRLLTFLPNGQATTGTLADGVDPEAENGTSTLKAASGFTNPVSRDGSRVFFMAGGNLYARLHAEQEPAPNPLTATECVNSAKACTIKIDDSQAGGPGGGATFLTANATGTKVFFIDGPAAKLTSDTEPASGENLYEYDIDTGKLTDLTGANAHAEVLGYSGFGEEKGGTYHLYFVADGVLETGGVLGKPNLYVVSNTGDSNTTTYIATLNSTDDSWDWGLVEAKESKIELLTTRTSTDGRMLAFESVEAAALAGYDNTPSQPSACKARNNVNPTSPCTEIFLYEAEAPKLICVSCDWGAVPSGSASLEVPVQLQDRPGPGYLTRYVLDDGSVFFESPDALVSGDVNGVTDVYEYQHGQVRLISSGAGTKPSTFFDASADGRDVFFETSQRILTSDVNDTLSVYDAREGGGFSEPVEPPGCRDEGCRAGANTQTLVFSVPASVSYTGSGNLTAPRPPAVIKAVAKRCKGGFVRRRRACVKRKRKPRKRAKRLTRSSRPKGGK